MSDGAKVALLMLAKPFAYVIGGLLLVGLGVSYCRQIPTNVSVSAHRDTVRIRDSIRVTVAETVTVYRRRVDTVRAESDRADSLVVIRDDSSAIVADTVAIVPPEIIADIRALRVTVATQDTLLRWWERKSAADSLAIAARDRLIHELRPPKCGRRCGFALGAASVAGLVYLVK